MKLLLVFKLYINISYYINIVNVINVTNLQNLTGVFFPNSFYRYIIHPMHAVRLCNYYEYYIMHNMPKYAWH